MTETMEQFSYQMMADIAALPKVAKEFAKYAEQQHFSSKLIHDLSLCLDEILNNIISYGGETGQQPQVSIKISPESDEVVLTVVDTGRLFNPLAHKAASISDNLQSASLGGIGLHLVNHIAKKVEYLYENGCNVLVIRIKNIG